MASAATGKKASGVGLGLGDFALVSVVAVAAVGCAVVAVLAAVVGCASGPVAIGVAGCAAGGVAEAEAVVGAPPGEALDWHALAPNTMTTTTAGRTLRRAGIAIERPF